MTFIADTLFNAMAARAAIAPEPNSCALLATDLLALLAWGWRRRG